MRYKAVHMTKDGKWHVIDEEGESVVAYDKEWEADEVAKGMSELSNRPRFGPRRSRRVQQGEEP